MILNQILTKYGTEIHFNESFKSRLDQNTHLFLMADFSKCEKGEKYEHLATCIWEIAGEIFFKIFV